MSEDRFSEYRQEELKKKKPFFCPENIIILVVFIVGMVTWYYAGPRLLSVTGADGGSEIRAHENGAYILKESPLVYAQIDVGQGNSVFIKFPNGKTMLYDGGEGDKPDAKVLRAVDAGRRIIVPFLHWLGVRKLDYIVVSHPDSDHCGGLDAVFKMMKVGAYADAGSNKATFTYKRVLKDVEKFDVSYRILKLGDEMDWGGKKVKLKVLSAAHPEDPDANGGSLLIKGTYGDFSFLLTGDLPIRREYAAIEKYGPQLKSTVLQVGHHGSYTATSRVWAKTVRPEYSFIGVGAYNTYGHPRKSVLKILESVNSKIIRTDHDGTALVVTNGKKWRVFKLDEWRLDKM